MPREGYHDSLVDAFAQCIWIRLRTYLRVGPSATDIWLCNYDDLPAMSKAPLRLAARDMLDIVFKEEAEQAA